MDEALLQSFEDRLSKSLLQLAMEDGLTDNQLLESPDITDRWEKLAPEYMADAVPEVAKYPTVSVSWAAYLGMAVAWCWNTNWSIYSNVPYNTFYGSDGFDNMDDHVTEDLLGLKIGSKEEVAFRNAVRRLAEASVSAIRHEGTDPQSEQAFYLFHSACKVMYKMGAGIALKLMGYKFEKVVLN